MRRVAPSEKLEQEFYAAVSTSEEPLSEAARRGARLILQRALEIELAEFLGRERYERSKDGPLMGYRNGYEPKTVYTAEGEFCSSNTADTRGTCAVRVALFMRWRGAIHSIQFYRKFWT